MRIFFVIILFISTLALFLGLSSLEARAAVPGLQFGGRIVAITPCIGGFMITVGGRAPGVYIYQVGISTLYRWYNLTPGNWVLGNAWPGYWPCFPVGGLLIKNAQVRGGIGTSLWP